MHTAIYAQVPIDTLESDSILYIQQNDSLNDNISASSQNNNYRMSQDAIEKKIVRIARDSSFFDKKNNIVYLYGNAVVVYEDIKITAGYIELNLADNLATAKGYVDSTGNISAFPLVEMDNEQFVAKEIVYNFKTNKGRIVENFRKEKDLYIRGSEAKFINKKQSDTTDEKTVFQRDAIITTCEHPLPHYGIRSRKQKLVLEKVAIVGPSNLEFNGVPSPIWLPFGFFPINQRKNTGLLFPRNYENSPRLGFGFKDVGWYFPINDYIDLQLKTDIYLRGSFAIKALSRYVKRYRYSGSVNLEYFSYRREVIENERLKIIREPSFTIRINHKQNAKAHPTINLGGSINIQTNSYKELTSSSVEAQLENTLTSNFNYSQQFPDANLNLTVGLSHTQNTRTHDIAITLPDARLAMNQIAYPFKRKIKKGKEQWYEKITFRYDAAFKNRIQTKDTTLFRQETLEDMQFGLEQKASSDINFNVFKYINVSPRINFTETWYWRTTRKELLDEYVIKYDTIIDEVSKKPIVTSDTLSYGVLDTRNVWGFEPLHLFNASLSANTSIFGTVRFKKGFIRGLRHTIKPSISLTYAPDYTDPDLDYFRYHHTDLRDKEDELKRYSIFDNGVFSRPSSTGLQLRTNFSINNIFEAKIFSKKDSVERNIKLLPRLTINSSYNYSADSLKLAPISFNGNFTLLKNFSQVSFSGSFSAYDRDDQGRTINQYLINEDKGLLRFVGMGATVTTGFTIDKLIKYIENLSSSKRTSESVESMNISKGNESISSVIGNFRINHSMAFRFEKLIEGDTAYISSHQVNINGRIPISQNWNIDVSRIGYSFTQKKITYPSLGISRDLHCWNMGISWQPEVQTYNFFIRVDPGTFGFIEVPYRKNQVLENTFF